MKVVSKITYTTEVTIYSDIGESSRSTNDYFELNGWERIGTRVGGGQYYKNHNYSYKTTYSKTFMDKDVMEKEVKEINILFGDRKGGVE